jgi:O-antigen ligase
MENAVPFAVAAAFALVPLMALSWLRPSLAAAAFCGLLPTYLIRLRLPFGLPTTFLELAFLAVFLPWLVRRGLKREAWASLDRWGAPSCLLLLGSAVGILVSFNWTAGLGIWRAFFLEPFLFFVVFADSIRTGRERSFAVTALTASVAVVSVWAVVQKFTGWGIPYPWQEAATRRVTSFFGYPNAVALFTIPIAMLLIGRGAFLIASQKLKPRLRAAASLAAGVLAVVASVYAVSEGGLIGAAAGLAVLGLVLRKYRAATLIAVTLACLVVMFNSQALHYASNVMALRDDSGSIRLVQWTETWRMLRDRPVFGAGLNGYRDSFAPYHDAKHIEIFMYPHNIVLNFWSETGLIGLAGFTWLIVLFFVTNARLVRTRQKSWLPPALIAAMVAILVHGLVDAPYLKNDLAMAFWMMVGLTESLAGPKQLPTPEGMDETAEA